MRLDASPTSARDETDRHEPRRRERDRPRLGHGRGGPGEGRAEGEIDVCPAGEIATGGGYRFPSGEGAHVGVSEPVLGDDFVTPVGWRATFHLGVANLNVTGKAFAVCIPAQ
jgi:hypothetical protein